MSRRRVFAVVLSVILIVAFSACKKEAPKESSEPVKADSPFGEMISVFEGFERVVKENRKNPAEGVRACREYAEKNIPRIKAIEEKMKGLETNPQYLKDMIDANNRIKEVSDKVTRIVTESYGVEGADVLMQLSDMALARL